MPEQTKEFGYKRTLYTFTGEYHTGAAGHRKATRNKDKFRAPVYRSEDGQVIVDMEQIEYLESEKEETKFTKTTFC